MMVETVDARPLSVRDMPKSRSIWIETRKSVTTCGYKIQSSGPRVQGWGCWCDEEIGERNASQQPD